MIKKHKALLAYMLALTIFTTYVVMDTFVITRVYGEAAGTGTEAAMQSDESDSSAEQAEGDAAAADTGRAAVSARREAPAAKAARERAESMVSPAAALTVHLQEAHRAVRTAQRAAAHLQARRSLLHPRQTATQTERSQSV